MLQIMSEEEVKESHEKIDAWIMGLDYNTKQYIRALLEPHITQANCEHEFIDPNTYENSLDKTMLFCRHCHVEKKIKL